MARRLFLHMPRRIPRALSLAASVAWGELRHDPVRAALLGVRLLPGRVRRGLRPVERRLAARARTAGPTAGPTADPSAAEAAAVENARIDAARTNFFMTTTPRK